MKEINNLNQKKASQDTDITVKNCEFFAEYICSQFNMAISSSKFPGSFKFASTTPDFKSRSKNKKYNFRLVSTLPTVSKNFDKIFCKQLFAYFENIQS